MVSDPLADFSDHFCDGSFGLTTPTCSSESGSENFEVRRSLENPQVWLQEFFEFGGVIEAVTVLLELLLNFDMDMSSGIGKEWGDVTMLHHCTSECGSFSRLKHLSFSVSPEDSE